VRKISKVRIEHHSWNRRADGVRSLILDTLVSLSEKPPLLKVVGVRHLTYQENKIVIHHAIEKNFKQPKNVRTVLENHLKNQQKKLKDELSMIVFGKVKYFFVRIYPMLCYHIYHFFIHYS